MIKWFSISKLLNYDYATQYFAAFIVSVGFLIEGMHYGWSSPVVPKLLESKIPITPEEATYITQMFVYGSITYNILSFADYPKLNLKVGLIASVFIMTISWILIGVSQSAVLFMIARFLAGAGRGLVYQVSTIYICEIASPEIRGFLGSLALIMTNLGVMLIFCFGPYLSIFYSSLIAAIISLTQLVAINWIPESPYTLLFRGKTREARNVFRRLRNIWNVEEELDKVHEIVKKEDEENSSFWSIFTVQSNRKAFFIIICLNGLQGLVGIHDSIHYILKLSGGNLESYRLAIVSSLISVVSCTLTALFIDYIGRKTILIISFLATGCTLALLGYFSFSQTEHSNKSSHVNMLHVSCLLCYTMVYRMGVGLVPLLLSAELFPMNVKNQASSLTELVSLAVNFGAVRLMESLGTVAGPGAVHWVQMVHCVLGAAVTCWFVPETTRVSLQQIQVQLKGNNNDPM